MPQNTSYHPRDYPRDAYQRERPGRSPDEYDRAYPMGMASDPRRGSDVRMPADMRPESGRDDYDQDPWRYEGGQTGRQARPYGEYRDRNNRSEMGQRGMQRERSFRGMGPRGYRRSDDRILEDVCDRLTDHSAIDPSDIEIKVSNGEVTLEGTVESRRIKHLVEDIADDTAGVTDVHNRIRVSGRRPGSREHSAESGENRQEEEGNGPAGWSKKPSKDKSAHV